jgi:hypothetical protein
VAIRSFIEASWSTYAEQIILPSNRAAATASSLQTVYDLAAKRRVGLRFNRKNLTSKCASLRFTCNRQMLKVVTGFDEAKLTIRQLVMKEIASN